MPRSQTASPAESSHLNSRLTSVTIPESVRSIGFGALLGCYGLTAITVDSANQNYTSVECMLFDKGQTTLLQYPELKSGAYTIHNSVTNIGDYALYYCGSLTSVTIPDSVTG